MTWDAHSLRLLSDLVDRKFDEEFRENLSGWKTYLDSHEIIRKPWTFHKKRSSENPYVWIECPWSIHNSTPGAVYTKSELYFPMELAEKIVVLGTMP